MLDELFLMQAQDQRQGHSVEVEYGGVFELTFTKDGREVSIIITSAGNKTLVVITFLQRSDRIASSAAG